MGPSSIGSPILKARIPLRLHLPEHAWFDIEPMRKDIRLAREATRELAIPLPSAELADEILAQARELGYAPRDLAALHEVLAQTSPEPAQPDFAACGSGAYIAATWLPS